VMSSGVYTTSLCITKPTRSTQLCIPPGSQSLVPALISSGKGGNVTSGRWQVTRWLDVGSLAVMLAVNCYTRLSRMLWGCRACRAISPFSLPCTRLHWSVGGLHCRPTVLPFYPCVVSFSKSHEPDTHEYPRLTRPISSRHVSIILARMSRTCYEETAPMEFQLYRQIVQQINNDSIL